MSDDDLSVADLQAESIVRLWSEPAGLGVLGVKDIAGLVALWRISFGFSALLDGSSISTAVCWSQWQGCMDRQAAFLAERLGMDRMLFDLTVPRVSRWLCVLSAGLDAEQPAGQCRVNSLRQALVMLQAAED